MMFGGMSTNLGGRHCLLKSRCLIAGVVLLVAHGVAAQTTWYVDDDNCPGPGTGGQADPFCSIQDGIEAAAGGDTVLAAPGTYFEMIDLLGKAITVRGADGAEVTIIDAGGLGRVVTCATGEGPDTMLEGFTITGGAAQFGAGMYNAGARPTVSGCTFTNNIADGGTDAVGMGGAMYNAGGSPTVADCTFSSNRAIGSNASGGAIYNSEGSLTLTNCAFNANNAHTTRLGAASAVGGAIYNGEADLTVTGCAFTANSLSGNEEACCNVFQQGGAICAWGGDATLSDCTFTDNLATGGGILLAEGGAMYIGTATLALTNCKFTNNSVSPVGGAYGFWLQGGAIYAYDVTAMFTNCTFNNNSATEGTGGALYAAYGSVTVSNSTFSGNSADVAGGAIYDDHGTSPMNVVNSISWSNPGGEIAGAGGTTVTYSDVQGGFPGVGNIDADPLFFDADGPDNIPGTPDDNLRLLGGSPCIDAADNTAVPAGVTTDLDGFGRFVDDPATSDTGNPGPPGPIVDMGPYEYSRGDCKTNGVPDRVDIGVGTSEDCNVNEIPDECEPDEDCNGNGIQDICDLFDGTSDDCNGNAIPDECEPQEDCNANGVQDICDIAAGTSRDCNGDNVPDECPLCTRDCECFDWDPCTFDYCDAGLCYHDPQLYGDTQHNDTVNLFDIFCILDGIAGDFSTCSFEQCDVHPCTCNEVLNLFDVFAVLDAIGGEDACCSGP